MDTLPPEERIAPLLRAQNWKLVTAESCTGGMIGHLVTNLAGSSDYYLGGVVSYSNELKMLLLGVKESTLIDHGAVSEQTALEMARGVRERLGGDIGISVTGIAGPGGATETKPLGLTFIGLSAPWGDSVRRFVWDGNRMENKAHSAAAALEFLFEELNK